MILLHMSFRGKAELYVVLGDMSLSPIRSDLHVEGIFAVGADLNNAFAIGKNKDIILSQYIGNMQEKENQIFFETSMLHFFQIFRFSPEQIICDLHPEYFSTAIATNIRYNIMFHYYMSSITMPMLLL